MQQRHQQKRSVPAALWSEIFASWRNCARRPALPLLLALLLFICAPFTASSDCASEMGEHPHPANSSHAHGVAASEDDHHAHDDAVSSHHAHDSAPHAHDSAPHANVSHSATLQAPVSCCSCSSEPTNALIATTFAPKSAKAELHAVIYAVVDASPIYRDDALEGLHTRAGPKVGKPQLCLIASLIGRAPPISL